MFHTANFRFIPGSFYREYEMQTIHKIRLALICGGTSAEREISLKGAQEVEKALDPTRYTVTRYDPASDLEKLVRDSDNLDAAFILLHGRHGEDGTIQGLLDLIGIPYQGSGVLGSALAMDKHMSKIIYQNAGIPTPEWIYLEKTDPIDTRTIITRLGLPLMVKPCVQGSSVGMSRVEEESELEKAIIEALKWDNCVLVESCLIGRELTGGVLGDPNPEPLPLVEIIPGDDFDFFDYVAKYQPGATREICPAEVTEAIASRARDLALKAHNALRLRAYSRTDMILTGDDRLFVLETNTIPGMTPTSLFPQAARAAGIPFARLLDRLIKMALGAKNWQTG